MHKLPEDIFDKALSPPRKITNFSYEGVRSSFAFALGDMEFEACAAHDYEHQSARFDEKHYLLVPYPDSDEGFYLFRVRQLPHGVPYINRLPKRHIFHFPNADCEAQVLSMMVANAKRMAVVENEDEEVPNQLVDLSINLVHRILVTLGLEKISQKLKSRQQKLNKRQQPHELVAHKFYQASTIRFINPVLTTVEKCYERKDFNAIEWLDMEQRLIKGDKNKQRFLDIATKATYAIYQNSFLEDKRRPFLSRKPDLLPKNLYHLLSIYHRIDEQNSP